jgi:hypothetical protein
MSGIGRGEVEPSDASAERPTKVNTASGAAFNCGRECTIVHRGLTLTINDALLASNPQAAPAVTLQLNGRQMSVLDSFNPPAEIPATAAWKGNKLVITSSGTVRTTTQLLSIEASELIVITSTGTDAPRVTLKYKKR